MPRKPRRLSSTGIYHVILRSVNQHIIFEEDHDFRKFLYILADCKKKYDIQIYAYCLMDNHIHLLLYAQPDSLAGFFQSLGTKFARWYNNKYSRSGHLFQGRFHSVAIETHRAFLSALSYIHNNPVKANICRYPSEYRWNSFNAYFGQKSDLVTTDVGYKIAGSKHNLQQYLIREDAPLEQGLFENDHRPPQHFLTDEKALARFKKITKLSNTSETVNLKKPERNTFIRSLREGGLTIRQIARLMDISETTVKRYSHA
ncbi:MAG: transposase [Lachnospiraceae bacterium]|nr:transposase [Lachnospiraceae bacterium]